MHIRVSAVAILAVSASLAAVVACGEGSRAASSLATGDAGGGPASSVPAPAPGPEGGPPPEGGAPVFAFDAAPPAACAVSTERARAVPLDLELLLDTSGSMSDLTAPGQSKWGALAAALAAFVRDPASAGIGVGVRYFPLAPAGVPASCTSSADCGDNGPCLVGQCDDGSGDLCATDDDCPFGACATAAGCQGDLNVSCGPPGAWCGPDANGFDLGICEAQPRSYCAVSDSCAATDYARAAVEVAPLPGAAPAIVSSLAAQQPHGGTPTPAALEGAITGATSYARSHPTHTVIAVLATDGVPNESADPLSGLCAPADPGAANATLAQTAAAAAAGTPAVQTFAIGVFAPDEVDSGAGSLTAIARAGGSDQPFVVETGSAEGGVEAQLTAAFARIRQATLPCEYAVPTPDGGTPDFTRLNVEYTSGAGETLTVPHVDTPGRCGSGHGWYYEVNSDAGASPRSIAACPTTCAALRADPAGHVDVVLGCITVVR